MNASANWSRASRMCFECVPRADGFGTGDCVLFLPGWGFRGDVIALEGLPPLQVFYPTRSILDVPIEEYLEFIKGLKGQGRRVILMGWSMGGVYVYRYIDLFKEVVHRVVFCSMRKNYPAVLIESMCEMLKRDKGLCLRYFYRECFKGQAIAYKRFKQGIEEKLVEAVTIDELLRGLEFLQENPVDELKSCGTEAETLLIHGEDDAVAPVGLMPEVDEGVKVVLFKGCGHLPFLEQGFFKELIGVEGGG